jgi:hypothetical protein
MKLLIIALVLADAHFVGTDYLRTFARKMKECRLQSYEIV